MQRARFSLVELVEVDALSLTKNKPLYGKKILFNVIASPTVHVAEEILYLSEIVDVIGAVYHTLEDPDEIDFSAGIATDGFVRSNSRVESEKTLYVVEEMYAN